MTKSQSEVWQKRSFPYVPMNDRDSKPRSKSITEIRGPYYAPVTPTYTKELLEGMGEHVDGYKYAGGSFSLRPLMLWLQFSFSASWPRSSKTSCADDKARKPISLRSRIPERLA